MSAAKQNLSDGDLFVRGVLTMNTLIPSAGCVDNAAVKAGAGIVVSKLQHQHEFTIHHRGLDTLETRAVHVVYGANGTLVAFRVGIRTVLLSTNTLTVDLLKNGVSVLSAPVTIDSTVTAYQKVVGTISSTALVAGDVLEVKFTLTCTKGAGPVNKGLFASLVLTEDAQ